MNCFNHRDKPAIGICQSCGKGLCEECLAELPNGLACKGLCEKKRAMIDQMVESTMQSANRKVRAANVFGVLLAVTFGIFSVWAYFETGGFLPYFLGVLAVVMLCGSVAMPSRKLRYPPTEE
jgi:hypothetical protein